MGGGKKQYSRIWSQFRDFVPEHDFELAPPAEDSFSLSIFRGKNNYLLTDDSSGPVYNRFHRGKWITLVSVGEGALDTPGA